MIISYTCAGPALTSQNPWHEKGPLLFVSCDAEKKVEVSTLIVRIYDLLQILTTNISGLKQNNKKKKKILNIKASNKLPLNVVTVSTESWYFAQKFTYCVKHPSQHNHVSKTRSGTK